MLRHGGQRQCISHAKRVITKAYIIHDGHFPQYWPFVRRTQVESSTRTSNTHVLLLHRIGIFKTNYRMACGIRRLALMWRRPKKVFFFRFTPSSFGDLFVCLSTEAWWLISVRELGSGNGSALICQAITWTSADIVLIGSLSEILIKQIYRK